MTAFTANQQVKHRRHGNGRVEFVKARSAIVRFGEQLLEVLLDELELVTDAEGALRSGQFSSPSGVLAKIQAAAITSVNDTWGLFSRSRVALLPHQLWVCRQVISRWPSQWLIADDVGLGKTVEAGLILWPLIARKRVRRLLILCPAALVEQWQFRLRTMFDIRVFDYVPEADTPKKDYWRGHPFVVASLQTMRDDRNGRHQRLLEAEPWDLVIVDEAHHLYAPEAGSTLGYQLLEKLQVADKFRSLLLFSGTPHRGNDHAFLALLKLLDPASFDPRRPLQDQLGSLSSVLIRNNKQQVTDLSGKALFEASLVRNVTYTYSEAERTFYDLLTDFISTGRAYANTLSGRSEQTVRLVLIAMQKLASSSIAAIRSALLRRIDALERADVEIPRPWRSEIEEDADDGDLLLNSFILMGDEPARLRELLEAASDVMEETKIIRILEVLETEYAGRTVLFFTEYKATQALLFQALTERYGEGCALFINGDDRLVVTGRVIESNREDAAEQFNGGRVRFLISTEAGGEGIDLQMNCHTLIHVDLPWNPMRLHQRVGRLNRYGQTKRVEVLMIRNPDTVEGRIWSLLNEKLERIRLALNSAMDDPEDLLQLVLGMSDSSIFEAVYHEGGSVPRERLVEWFDAKTGQLGGEDVLLAVKNLIGHSAGFDFANVSKLIPRLDLPALEPFFQRMLVLNRRKVRREPDGMGFITPDPWKSIGILPEYERMVFDRTLGGLDAGTRILGVGHKLVDRALEQAEGLPDSGAVLSGLLNPILVYEVTEELTDFDRLTRRVIFALELCETPRLLKDWEVLEWANKQKITFTADLLVPLKDQELLENVLARARPLAQQSLQELDLDFVLPRTQLIAALWPPAPH